MSEDKSEGTGASGAGTTAGAEPKKFGRACIAGVEDRPTCGQQDDDGSG